MHYKNRLVTVSYSDTDDVVLVDTVIYSDTNDIIQIQNINKNIVALSDEYLNYKHQLIIINLCYCM